MKHLNWIVLSLSVFLLPGATSAQERTPTVDSSTKGDADASPFGSLRVYGRVSGSYTTNLASPSRREGANALRTSDPDHDTFNLTEAVLGLVRGVSGRNELDAGFRLEASAGRLAETTINRSAFNVSGSSSFLDIADEQISLSQAYLQVQVPTPINPVEVTFGRSYAWFGVESLDLTTNPHFSLSHLTRLTPNTVTGLSLGMDLLDGLRYTQYVVQGWDVVEDDNDAKTFGGQLRWQVSGLRAVVVANWILGAEQAGNDHDQRWAIELGMNWKPTDSMEVRMAGVYGQEEYRESGSSTVVVGTSSGSPITQTIPFERGATAEFGGALLSIRQSFFAVEGADFHRLSLAVRGGYMRDRGGRVTGFDQHLGEVTATAQLNLLERAGLRVEYRRDFSNEHRTFGGSRGQLSRSSQDTVSFSLHLAF